MAIRVARGYRTISHESALTLAGTVQIDFLAEGDAFVYERLQNLRRENGAVSLKKYEDLRRQARLAARAKWKAELVDRGGRTASSRGGLAQPRRMAGPRLR